MMPFSRSLALACCHIWLAATSCVAGAIAHARGRHAERGPEVVALLGPFKLSSWLDAYARPLVASGVASRVIAFTERELATCDGLEQVVAPPWLVRAVGGAVARFIICALWSLRYRPTVLIGFHLPSSGVVALLIARLVGCRALYFCVGGVNEIRDGGIHSEQPTFVAVGAPNRRLEARLVAAANRFDAIATMGTLSAAALRYIGVRRPLYPLAVALGSDAFARGMEPRLPQFDVITVARLAPIKRLDRLIDACARLHRAGRRVSVVVLGDGGERERLRRLAADLGVSDQICFAGLRSDVGTWLLRARVFVLTSESEGLPISMLEAMAHGLPVVVPAVGDIPAVVPDGLAGCLVEDMTPEGFATAIEQVLSLDEGALRDRGRAAFAIASDYGVAPRALLWTQLFESWHGDGDAGGGVFESQAGHPMRSRAPRADQRQASA